MRSPTRCLPQAEQQDTGKDEGCEIGKYGAWLQDGVDLRAGERAVGGAARGRQAPAAEAQVLPGRGRRHGPAGRQGLRDRRHGVSHDSGQRVHLPAAEAGRSGPHAAA